MSVETLDSLDGERGIPSVNTVTTNRWKRGALLLFLLAAAGLSAATAYVKFGQPDPAKEAPRQRVMQTASTVPPRTFVDVPEPAPAPAPVPPPVPALPVQPIVPVAVRQPQPARPLQPLRTPPTLDKAASRATVIDNRSSQSVQVAQAPISAGQPGDLFGGNSAGDSELNQSLQPTKLTATSANLLRDRNFMLTRGAFIDCVLSTRLDSTVPGMTSCTVTRDVFSANGNVVLIERGSLVTGEYRSNLRQGMNRIFVLWSRVETPMGVVINLDSPATDSLGGSGVAGHIDTHFWQRFGGALLLSLIDDAAQIASNRGSNNEDTQIVLNSAGNVSSELAAEVLRNTINIPPTLYANQGSRVGIFVARDLDFSGVYDVAAQ